MKHIVVLFPLLILNSSVVSAQDFTISDQRLGDPSINYVNPEISPVGNFMVWIEIDTTNGFSGKVWHCGLDPDTGDLIPENGKGYNPFSSNVYARPADWGVDMSGPYYIGLNLQGQFVFVRPTGPNTAEVEILPTAPDIKRRVIYPSQLPDMDKRFITYILNDEAPGGANNPVNTLFELRFLDLDDPLDEKIIETQTRTFPAAAGMDGLVPRWIKGTPYLTYGFTDSEGYLQAKEFNALHPDSMPVIVSSDPTTKTDGYPVYNPFNGFQYLISGSSGTNNAQVYRRSDFGDQFAPLESVSPASTNLTNPALNQSHEPFFFSGQLYTTFQINEDGGDFLSTTLNEPGEVWITSIDSANNQTWQISDFNPELNISEPEPFSGNQRIWVYYSANVIDENVSILNRTFQLRRCETPMNQWATSNEHVDFAAPDELTLYPSYPNPFNTSTVIRYELSSAAHIKIEVFTSTGTRVAVLENEQMPTGQHQLGFDAYHLPSGIYLLRLRSENVMLNQKLTLIK